MVSEGLSVTWMAWQNLWQWEFLYPSRSSSREQARTRCRYKLQGLVPDCLLRPASPHLLEPLQSSKRCHKLWTDHHNTGMWGTLQSHTTIATPVLLKLLLYNESPRPKTKQVKTTAPDFVGQAWERRGCAEWAQGHPQLK